MRRFRCLAVRLQHGQDLDFRATDPIRNLLRRLRTRVVTLLVGGRELRGKVVSLQPVTLTGEEGQVIVVRLEAIQAVIF